MRKKCFSIVLVYEIKARQHRKSVLERQKIVHKFAQVHDDLQYKENMQKNHKDLIQSSQSNIAMIASELASLGLKTRTWQVRQQCINAVIETLKSMIEL